MKTATPSLPLSIAIATLLTGTALVAPHAVSAAASDLQAQTGWAISRVASTTKGSYCTMAQKYSNGTVLTIAKNNGNEYSLAFDFQSPKFQVGKVTPASVRAGSGTAQTFEVQPASPQVVVIGLGPDEAFMNSLKESGKVQLEIEGESYAFNTAKFGEAQDELSTCMSSMKSQVREAKATEAQQAEQAEKAEKVASAQPMPATAAAAPVTEKIIFDEPPAKTASAAKSSGLSAEDLTAAPVEPLAAPATVTAMAAPAPAVDVSNASALEAENARLKQALGEARRSYENQMTTQQGARIPELQEKIDGLQAENARLRDEAAKASAQASSKQDLTRVSAELDKARKDLAAAQAQNTNLQTQVSQAQQSQAASASEKQLAAQAQRDVEALKAENQTLKNQLQLSANAEQKTPSAETTKLADLQAENAALTTNLDLTNKKVSELQAAAAASQKSAPAVKNDQASAEMQKRISELQAENASLKAQAQDALTPMAAQANAGELTPSDQENLRGQIRDLRSQLEIVESESAGLRKQLETAQRDSEGKQLKVAGGNWDLEQATRRYQESQREIRRLGALLEQDRVKCQEEKKDIEYMLFDPEVAKPAQIAMLGSLEDQIAAKDARIAELEGRAPASSEAKANIKQQAVASEKLLAADMKPMVESEPLAETKPLQAPNSPTQVAARPVESAPIAPAPVATAAPQQAATAPTSQSSKFQSSQDFTGILKSAGLTIRGTVQPVQKVASDNYKAYSWQTDSLFGSAEQRAMADQGGFEPAVQQYIDRAKSRCQGEFAAVPAQISGSIPAEGYEIACVSGQTGSSASVLFTYKDGIMTTVAHEGRAEAMDIAMDARDRVAAKIVAN